MITRDVLLRVITRDGLSSVISVISTTNKRLVVNETVVPCQSERETRKFGSKQVDEGKIFTVKRIGIKELMIETPASKSNRQVTTKG